MMLRLPQAAGSSSEPGGALLPASAKIMFLPDSLSTLHTTSLVTLQY